MNHYSLTIHHNGPDAATLRLLNADGGLVGERNVPASELDSFAAEIAAAYVEPAPNHQTIGQRLYQWIDGSVHGWMQKIFADNQPTTLGLTLNQIYRHLPWELLQQDGVPLCTNPLRPFAPVRTVNNRRLSFERQNRPLRVLLMATSPTDVQPLLDYEKEEAMILDATRRHPLELVVEESGSLRGLTNRVESYGENYFDAFHLSGHANIKDGVPIFIMEDDFGYMHTPTAEEIAKAFGGIWPRLVFLSGCKTAQAATGALPSFCEAMVEAGAPAVLGWAMPVYDQTANIAAAELYGNLSTGRRIDDAIARTRQKLHEENAPDWHLLRLYSDATPLAELITPVNTPDRARLHVRDASRQFKDARLGDTRVCSRKEFVGRRRAIQNCMKVLRSREVDEHYGEGVVLQGMGGLGKSSMAARLCDRLENHGRVVVFGRLDYIAIVKALVDGLKTLKCDNIADITAQVMRILNTQSLSIDQKLSSIFFGPLNSNPLMFVLDDFEANCKKDEKGEPILKDGDEAQAVFEQDALDTLHDLAMAIRATSSDSRLIITSRYSVPARPPIQLFEEKLDSFRGSELEKKIQQLDGFQSESGVGADIRRRAEAAADGNPRLLEWLNNVLLDPESDSDALMAAIEDKAEEFRESIFLETLLGAQTEECRETLAHLALFHVPIPVKVLQATCGIPDINSHLERTTRVGLVEVSKTNNSLANGYYVSRIAAPLLVSNLSEARRMEASGEGANALFAIPESIEKHKRFESLVEIHRLAMFAGAAELAAKSADLVAKTLFSTNRFLESAMICRSTLSLVEDFRVIHNLARAQSVLGETTAARAHYERAIELCPGIENTEASDVVKEYVGMHFNLGSLLIRIGETDEAMLLYEKCGRITEPIGDEYTKAGILHMTGTLSERQGNVNRAITLFKQSLEISERTGNLRGKGVTLHTMACVIASQGNGSRAIELWKQCLEIYERIGEEWEKATTLNQMAKVIAQQGDKQRAINLWNEALEISERIGDAAGQAAVLHNLGSVIAKEGNFDDATALLTLSLEISDSIDDPKRKAATLAQLANMAGKQGYKEKEKVLYLEAIEMLARIRAWLDCISVLSSFSATDEKSDIYLPHAIWLALRTQPPVLNVVGMCYGLLKRVEPQSDTALLVAAYAKFCVATRARGHPKEDALRKYIFDRICACANVRYVDPENLKKWFISERLNDPSYFIPALNAALEDLIGDAWVFDRKTAPALVIAVPDASKSSPESSSGGV